MTAELIEFYAKDGVALNGYIIKNKKKTKKLLIEIHGMTSNCFKKRERVIAETAVKMTNVDTICINTRGSEITKYIKNMQGEKKLAGTAYEGTYIHKKDGYYYFFASIGTCCEGLKSTYTTVVGRSKKLFGPYVDKSGKKMLDNHHEVLIHKNDAFVGTGHNSEIVTDKAGNDWMFYHAVSTKNPGGRVLMMDKVNWKDGWPSVAGSSPSIEAERPEM